MSDAITYKAAAETHSDELFDVVALLDAAADRIRENTPLATENAEVHVSMHNTLRLVVMAKARAEAAAMDLGNAC